MTDQPANPTPDQPQAAPAWPTGLKEDGSPDWVAITQGLDTPFGPADVKQREGRDNLTFDYIDARAVASRLDAVVGKWNWSFTPQVISEATGAVCGALTICGVTKADFGYPNNPVGATAPNRDRQGDVIPDGQPGAGTHRIDSDEPLKDSNSDALKRAAVLWGIGRHLYDKDQARSNKGAGKPMSTNQIKFLDDLLAQNHIPITRDMFDAMGLTGGKGGTASAWIDRIKADGANATVPDPKTGESLPVMEAAKRALMELHGQEGDAAPDDQQAVMPLAGPVDLALVPLTQEGQEGDGPCTPVQRETLMKLAGLLNAVENPDRLTVSQANHRIQQLTTIYNNKRRQPAAPTH